MFFDVYIPLRAKAEMLDKINQTIRENPDREFEGVSHFIRSSILYYCRYLDDLKDKAVTKKIKKRNGSRQCFKTI